MVQSGRRANGKKRQGGRQTFPSDGLRLELSMSFRAIAGKSGRLIGVPVWSSFTTAGKIGSWLRQRKRIVPKTTYQIMTLFYPVSRIHDFQL